MSYFKVRSVKIVIGWREALSIKNLLSHFISSVLKNLFIVRLKKFHMDFTQQKNQSLCYFWQVTNDSASFLNSIDATLKKESRNLSDSGCSHKEVLVGLQLRTFSCWGIHNSFRIHFFLLWPFFIFFGSFGVFLGFLRIFGASLGCLVFFEVP